MSVVLQMEFARKRLAGMPLKMAYLNLTAAGLAREIIICALDDCLSNGGVFTMIATDETLIVSQRGIEPGDVAEVAEDEP